jgi:hypothetical protein
MSSPPTPREFVFRCNLRRSVGGLKGLTPKSAAADMADDRGGRLMVKEKRNK